MWYGTYLFYLNVLCLNLSQHKSLKLLNAFTIDYPVPVLVGDDAPLYFLVVLANANGKPGTQFAIVQGIHYSEYLTLIKTQAIRRLFFILEMSPDIK